MKNMNILSFNLVGFDLADFWIMITIFWEDAKSRMSYQLGNKLSAKQGHYTPVEVEMLLNPNTGKGTIKNITCF